MDYRKEIDILLGRLNGVESSPAIRDRLIARACEKAGLARVEYTLAVPRNLVERDGLNTSCVLYDGGAASGLLCMTKRYEVPSVRAVLEIHFYYPEIHFPSDEEVAAYDSLGGVLFLFLCNKYLNDTLLHVCECSLLTDLPFRENAAARYDREVMAEGRGQEYTFLFLNIENMKYYNRRYGAELGDRVLYTFARLLRSRMQEEEYICHPGGDNFVAVVHSARAEAFVKDMLVCRLPAMPGIRDDDLEVKCWCGVAEPGEAYGLLPFNARLFMGSSAMQQGKYLLKKHLVYFSEGIARQNEWSRRVVNIFESSLARGEIVAYFQPKVEMATGRMAGMEVLARWRHEGKLLSAPAFVPLLESSNLVHLLDQYMMKEACKAIHAWREAGLDVPRVSVNLSRNNLRDAALADKIMACILQYNVPFDSLEFEVPESLPLDDVPRLVEFATAMHKLGLRIAIDDFGGGFSSLRLLDKVPADAVKMDRQVVDDLRRSDRSRLILKSFIGLAGSLGLDLAAVGVETQEQADLLQAEGCTYAQGALYAMPLSYEEMRARLGGAQG